MLGCLVQARHLCDWVVFFSGAVSLAPGLEGREEALELEEIGGERGSG